MREEGIFNRDIAVDELQFEAGLRPRKMDEFIGQAGLKERLSILIEAARGRGESVDHVLFSGPPGLGKTSISLGAFLTQRLQLVQTRRCLF